MNYVISSAKLLYTSKFTTASRGFPVTVWFSCGIYQWKYHSRSDKQTRSLTVDGLVYIKPCPHFAEIGDYSRQCGQGLRELSDSVQRRTPNIETPVRRHDRREILKSVTHRTRLNRTGTSFITHRQSLISHVCDITWNLSEESEGLGSYID